MTKHKILVIYDVSKTTADGVEYGWAYWNRSRSLKKYAPPDFEVDIAQYSEVPWSKCGEYALVLNLEYAAPSRNRIKGNLPNRDVILVCSFNSDRNRRQNLWDGAYREADFLIVNNQDQFDFKNRAPRTCCISNGVDIDLWRPTVPIADRPHKLLWTGSSGPTKGKCFQSVFQPLEKLAPQYGFETDFRPINDINEKVVYPPGKQVDWYSSGSYILCSSVSEGTPGTSLEGMACGCVLVSVPVGNCREFGRQHENMVIIPDRTPESFLAGLQYAREHRERLSAAGVETMQQWAYGEPGHRAQWYFSLFRKLIERKPVKPFSYAETHWSEI